MQDASLSEHTSAPTRRHGWLVAAALALILLAGGYFRFVGLNWDDYTYLHPDERFLNDVASQLGGAHWMMYVDIASLPVDQQQTVLSQRQRCLERYPESSGVGGYFDAECSTWNPHNVSQRFPTFVYGTLPLFAARATAELLVMLTGDTSFVNFFQIQLVWRTLSALAEMSIIIVVFFIGVRAHNRWVGLLAAGLYSTTVFSIQQAHFGTSDPISNLFAALTILFAVCVQKDGKLRDYALFGVAFGCALASRVNLLPLVGLLLLAAGLRLLPAFAGGLDASERERLWRRGLTGLALAGACTLIAFRLFNPYAFMGPGIFGIFPNIRWFGDIEQARYFVSGNWDAPPNWQWVARAPYVFPFVNIVLWGMGIALGLASWLAFVWALYRIVRGRPGALANALLVAWVAAYFIFMGRQWVMTMRYFLPLYPALAALAGWGLVTLVRGARSLGTESAGAQSIAPYQVSGWRRAIGWAAIIGVGGFTLLWAVMFTDIYRNLSNRVAASYWFWEQVPSDFALRLEDAPPGTPLINIALQNRAYPGDIPDLVGQATRFVNTGDTYTLPFTAPASGTVTRIHAPHLGDVTDGPEAERLRFAIYRAADNLQVASATLEADLPRNRHPLGDAYDIPLDEPLTVSAGQAYRFEVVLEAGTNVVSGGSVVVWEGSWDDPLPVKTCTPSDNLSLADDPPPGRFSWLDCQGRDAYAALLGGGYKLEIVNNDTPLNRDHMLALLDTADYVIISSNRFYDSMTRNPMRWPMTTRYYNALWNGELGFDVAAVFNRAFGLGSVRIPDNHLPFFSAPAWLNEFEAEEAFHVYDHPAVVIMQKNGDRYTAQNARTILYSVVMAQPPEGGGNGILRCPESPETYYCDPVLYDQDVLTSLEASRPPTYLMLTAEAHAADDTRGTWSERFDSDSLINTQPVLTVIAWWAAILVFGWAAWPLLFCVFPALADRGYGVAKAAGLLLVAWGVWYAASLRTPVWSGAGVLAGLMALALLSLLVSWRRRAELTGYVRRHWHVLLGIEAITLVCFIGYLLVRMTNPDLWHFSFGGEKPMDFAYFNAVLRSSVFPAFDPWFAGGYINYYYFGFVIAGAPTLLLGIVPAIAYNLLIPTFFAVTGIAAFSAAFNLVAGLREQRAPTPDDPLATTNPEAAGAAADPARAHPWFTLSALFFSPVGLAAALVIWQINLGPGIGMFVRAALGVVVLIAVLLLGSLFLRLMPRRWFTAAATGRMQRLANPWMAGMAALMLAVVFGNLDTPRTFMSGLAAMSVQGRAETLDAFLLEEALTEAERSGQALDYTQLEQRVSNPTLWDQLRFGLMPAARAGESFSNLLAGATLTLAPHRWYWGPTRIIGETLPPGGNEIAEMPWFTFLYGDLHAHMLAMPLHLLALAFLLNEVLSALGGNRTPRQAALALLVGAITVGMLLATNSWDWITYIILSIAGLGFAWWLRYQSLNRRSLLALVGTVGGFFVLSQLASLPYTTWFASAYTSVQAWQQAKTPLWIYVSIYGVFLFLIISLLIWETARWFRSVKVSALADTFPLVAGALMLLVAVIAGAAVAALAGYQVALVVLPLLAWIFVLFFRSGQTRAMQFWLTLVGLALALTLGVEVVVLSGDIGRQNTIFKFYMQAWLLLSVAGGAAFAWLWEHAARWKTGMRQVWSGIGALLFFVAGAYPVMSTWGRAQDRFNQLPPTLDGLAYMQSARHGENDIYFDLAPDYRIIRWLQEHVQGTPTIMEGQSEPNLYKWGSRIAINTGLPAVVGWDWHQTQQRGLYLMPMFIRQRGANVNAFYTTLDTTLAQRILDFYDVEYVVVGALERVYYRPEALAKFDAMVRDGALEIAYRDGEYAVYRVVHQPQVTIASSREN